MLNLNNFKNELIKINDKEELVNLMKKYNPFGFESISKIIGSNLVLYIGILLLTNIINIKGVSINELDPYFLCELIPLVPISFKTVIDFDNTSKKFEITKTKLDKKILEEKNKKVKGIDNIIRAYELSEDYNLSDITINFSNLDEKKQKMIIEASKNKEILEYLKEYEKQKCYKGYLTNKEINDEYKFVDQIDKNVKIKKNRK